MGVRSTNAVTVLLLGGPHHDTSVVVEVDRLRRNGCRLYVPENERANTAIEDVPIQVPRVSIYELRKDGGDMFFVGYIE